MITIPQTQQILQSYFQTGKEPTQDQFAELIGTMFYLFNETVNASQQAVNEANAAVAAVAAGGVAASLKVAWDNNGNMTVQGTSVNINRAAIDYHIDNVDGHAALNVPFTTPFANALYKVLMVPSANWSVYSQTPQEIYLSRPQGYQLAGTTFYFLIFP